MLDILLIQYKETATNLIEYRHEKTKLKEEHTNIFSGFMNALQGIMSQELDIGNVSLISTSGKNAHNLIIISKPPIDVIMLIDKNDPLDMWREQGIDICEEFIKMFGVDFIPFTTDKFQKFKKIISELCSEHQYCEEKIEV